MIDYKHMYAILCNAASEALDYLPENTDTMISRKLLQDALYETEKLYIQNAEEASEYTAK